MYINYTNVSLQRFNVINSEWPNVPCHFLIQVGQASWFVYLRPAWADCQIMKPAYGRRCTKNKHFFRVSTNTCSTRYPLPTRRFNNLDFNAFPPGQFSWIRGIRSGAGTGLSPSTSVSPCHVNPPTLHVHSFICRRFYVMFSIDSLGNTLKETSPTVDNNTYASASVLAPLLTRNQCREDILSKYSIIILRCVFLA